MTAFGGTIEGQVNDRGRFFGVVDVQETRMPTAGYSIHGALFPIVEGLLSTPLR